MRTQHENANSNTAPSPTNHTPTKPPFESYYMNFTAQQQSIVDALYEAYPRRLRSQQLIAAMYEHDIDGGALFAANVLRIQISKIRQKLAGTGWSVPSAMRGDAGANNGLYCLKKEQEDVGTIFAEVSYNGGCSTNSGTVNVSLPRVSIANGRSPYSADNDNVVGRKMAA